MFSKVDSVPIHEGSMRGKIKSFLDRLPAGICRINFRNGGIIEQANDSFYRIIGYTKEQFEEERGNSVFNIVTSQVSLQINYILQALHESGEKNAEFDVSIVTYLGSVKQANCFIDLIDENPGLVMVYLTDKTSDIHNQHLLKSYRDRFDLILSISDSIVFEYDYETKTIEWWSIESCPSLYSPIMDNIPDNLFRSCIVEDSFRADMLKVLSRMHNGAESASCEVKCSFDGGDFIWYKWSMRRITIDGSNRAVGIASNINARKEAELAVIAENQRRTAMFADANCFFAANLTNDSFINFTINNSPFDYYDVPKSYSEFFLGMVKFVAEENRDTFAEYFNIDNLIVYNSLAEGEMSYEYKLMLQGKAERWERMTITTVADIHTGDVLANGYIRDITDYHQKRDELIRKSQRDALTGLLNKVNLELSITRVLSGARDDVHYAYIMIDIDNFKHINDEFGHMYGDDVLRRAACSIAESFRNTDVVGRAGGDEFVAFVECSNNPDELAAMADRLCHKIEAGFKSDTGITCSIGISMYPDNGSTMEELYNKADKALYLSKHHGKNTYEICCLN